MTRKQEVTKLAELGMLISIEHISKPMQEILAIIRKSGFVPMLNSYNRGRGEREYIVKGVNEHLMIEFYGFGDEVRLLNCRYDRNV